MINFRGVKKEAISEGVGVAFRGLLRGAPSKVGELCKTSSCSICHSDGIIRVMKVSAPLVLWQWLTLIIS